MRSLSHALCAKRDALADGRLDYETIGEDDIFREEINEAVRRWAEDAIRKPSLEWATVCRLQPSARLCAPCRRASESRRLQIDADRELENSCCHLTSHEKRPSNCSPHSKKEPRRSGRLEGGFRTAAASGHSGPWRGSWRLVYGLRTYRVEHRGELSSAWKEVRSITQIMESKRGNS